MEQKASKRSPFEALILFTTGYVLELPNERSLMPSDGILPAHIPSKGSPASFPTLAWWVSLGFQSPHLKEPSASDFHAS
jgi:hypothetical protein